ncbi:hypothetical protein [Streptomyces griseorubiginosus]|uniref:hypothetical protein n=1 Tax=Streptomyces griseorubiginosus TaxID=67304 RepID=UPI002E81F205|nr:hypothetical protein [Streptomyces griseorubiginosus]WUB58843.1 hypothetical protein OG942_43505 [Streptomyces griseorubiginosus]
MTTCPTHQTTAPPVPDMPHRTQRTRLVCKGCGAAAGSPEERRAHHCPCCGERFADGCTGTPRRRTCPHCGTLDTHTGQWLPPADPLADFLAKRYTRTPWFRAWEEASIRFGHDLAHHLVQVTTEIDRTHMYGEIVFGRHALGVRYGTRFEAASPCPRRDECRRGRVWTPVWTREDLLNVHLHGAGPGASGCDRARMHAEGAG